MSRRLGAGEPEEVGDERPGQPLPRAAPDEQELNNDQPPALGATPAATPSR